MLISNFYNLPILFIQYFESLPKCFLKITKKMNEFEVKYLQNYRIPKGEGFNLKIIINDGKNIISKIRFKKNHKCQ